MGICTVRAGAIDFLVCLGDHASMRVRLNVAAIFIAVGLGALIVTLLYDPAALIPRPPYVQWIFLVMSALASATFIGASALVDYLDRVTR
jgi:hypothetical protein